MTAPSKAAMDAAQEWHSRWMYSPGWGTKLATAFDAFAASQSAALLDALERLTVIVDDQLDGDFPEALEQARAAILAAKGGQS